MTFQPVLHPFLVLLLTVPAVVAAGWMLVRALRGRGEGGGVVVWALRVVLVLACGLLLLRPGIPGGQTTTLATDTDVVVVVDTTASMVAEDWDGDEPRMQGVRDDVRALVEAYPGARFALITSAASAELRLPLTTDTSALASAVDVLTPEVTGQSRGSSIGIAAPLLAETLERAADAAPERARMVFYLGDGEQTAATSPESFAAASTTVDGGAVLGYGSAEGGPMRENTGDPERPGGYIQYQGERALSVIDEDALRTIADQLGVEYLHRTADEPIALPEAPATSSYRDAGSTGQVEDLSWAVALVIVALLAVELVRASMLIVRMRGLAARPASASPSAKLQPSPETDADSRGLEPQMQSRGEGGGA